MKFYQIKYFFGTLFRGMTTRENETWNKFVNILPFLIAFYECMHLCYNNMNIIYVCIIKEKATQFILSVFMKVNVKPTSCSCLPTFGSCLPISSQKSNVRLAKFWICSPGLNPLDARGQYMFPLYKCFKNFRQRGV